ncbi:MAG: oligosaccharide flippase family protein [Bacteroides sp.]|nr:oligosaccharide flippase family protein [Bacteroides sp.]
MAVNQVKAGAALNYVIIGLNALTGLLYTPFMLRCLGQNEYGLYSLVASVIAYLTLLDFGFGSAITRFAAKIRATGTKQDEWRLYGMFMTAYCVIGILITIAGFILYSNTDRMFDRTMTPQELHQARIMMALMVGNLALTFPFSIFGSIINSYERFIFTKIISIVRIILSTLVLVCVLLAGYKAIGLIIVQTFFSLSVLVANAVYCFKRLKIKIEFNNYNYSLLKEISIYSFWNFLGAIIERIYWGTGQFVLGIYNSTIAVAIFSLGITLMNIYMSMSSSLNSVLLPRLTKLTTQKGTEEEISNIFIRTGRLQFSILSLILSGFAIFGKPFILLWGGSGYHDTYYVTLIFFIALLCPLIQNVGLSILWARGQQKFRTLVFLAIAAISLIAQILISKTYGPIGCAMVVGCSLFAGQWIVMNIYYYKRQHLNIPKFWKEIGKMTIVPLGMILIWSQIVGFLTLDTWIRLSIIISIFMILYVWLYYKFSMNSYERNLIISPIHSVIRRFFQK